MSDVPQSDGLSSQVKVMESSGLFDQEWYRASYSEEVLQDDPLLHFCREGWRKGFAPNPYFHPNWYEKTYGAEFLPGENPLLHYIRAGERENAWPSEHFDPEWYRDEYGIGVESPLGHYLKNRGSGNFSPLPGFDAAAYAKANPECLSPGLDPYLHRLQFPKQAPEPVPFSKSPMGWVVEAIGSAPEYGKIPESVPWNAVQQALRLFIPLLPFDEAWYCRQYPDVAQALKSGVIPSAHEHFIVYGFFEGRSPAAKWNPMEGGL